MYNIFYFNVIAWAPTMVSHLAVVWGFAPMTQKISKIWRVGAN